MNSFKKCSREVFDGRGALFTVGETPGVLLENAHLYSDPPRREVNMIFQFEHVILGLPEGKFGRRTLVRKEILLIA